MRKRIISVSIPNTYADKHLPKQNRRLIVANQFSKKMEILRGVIKQHPNRKVHYVSKLDDFQFTKVTSVTSRKFETGPNDLDKIFSDSPTDSKRPVIIIDLSSIDDDPKGLANLNDVMDPQKPSYNGRRIDSDVELYFIVSDRLLNKPKIREDFIDRLPGLDLEYQIDSQDLPSVASESNEFKESDTSVRINFLDYLHWESAFQSLGINAEGKFTKLPDRLSGVTTVLLENYPLNDPTFDLFIHQLRCGQYYFNGELTYTNLDIILSSSEPSLISLDRNIPKSESGLTWVLNPMTIDHAMDNPVFLGDDSTRQVAIQTGFLDHMSDGDELIVEPGLSLHQRACVENKLLQLGLSLRVVDSKKTVRSLMPVVQTSDPEFTVEEMRDEHRLKHPTNLPLCHIHLSSQSDIRSLFVDLKPKVLEEGVFEYLEPPFIEALRLGSDIVITGLEDNPDLDMMLRPIWVESPYIWHNGQRLSINSTITCVTQSDDYPVDLQRVASKSGIPIDVLTDIDACFQSFESDRPPLSISLCRMLYKQAEIQAGKGNPIERNHWGEAINTSVIKRYRQAPTHYKSHKQIVTRMFNIKKEPPTTSDTQSSSLRIAQKLDRRFRHVSKKHHGHRLNLIVGPPSAGKSYLPAQMLSKDPYSKHVATINFSPTDTPDTFWKREDMLAWLNAGKIQRSDLEISDNCLEILINDGLLKYVHDHRFNDPTEYYVVTIPPEGLKRAVEDVADQHGFEPSMTSHLFETLGQATQYFTVIVDEANLAPEGFWTQLLDFIHESDPFIPLGGQKIHVSPHHRLIMTGNLDMEGRGVHHFFGQHCPVMFFDTMTSDEIKYAVVSPFLKEMDYDETLVDEISTQFMAKMEELKDKLPDHLFTPRDYLDVLEFFKYLPEDSQRLDEAILYSFESRLERNRDVYPESFEIFFQNCIDSRRDVVLDTKSFVIKNHVFELWKQVSRVVDIDESYKGKRGHLTIGVPSMGKDALLDMVIEEVGYNDRVLRTSCKSTDLESIKHDINRAKKEGLVIIISELNILDSSVAEGYLNDALTGTAAPGFFLFATINPPDFVGREPLSPAFLSRFGESRVKQFNEDDMRTILKHKCGAYSRRLVDPLMRVIRFFDQENQRSLQVPRVTLRRVNHILALVQTDYSKSTWQQKFKSACEKSLSTHCYKLGKPFDQFWSESRPIVYPKKITQPLQNVRPSIREEEVEVSANTEVDPVSTEAIDADLVTVEADSASVTEVALQDQSSLLDRQSIMDVDALLEDGIIDTTTEESRKPATINDLIDDMIAHYEVNNHQFVDYSFNIDRESLTYSSFKVALKERQFPKEQYDVFKGQYRRIKSKSFKSYADDASKVAGIGTAIAIYSPVIATLGATVLVVTGLLKMTELLSKATDKLGEGYERAKDELRSLRRSGISVDHSPLNSSRQRSHNLSLGVTSYALDNPRKVLPTLRMKELSELSYGTYHESTYDRITCFDRVNNEGVFHEEPVLTPYTNDLLFEDQLDVLHSAWKDNYVNEKNHFRNVIPMSLSRKPTPLPTTMHHPEEVLLMLHLPSTIRVHQDANQRLYLSSNTSVEVEIECITMIPDNSAPYHSYSISKLEPLESTPEPLLFLTDKLKKVMEIVFQKHEQLQALLEPTMAFSEKVVEIKSFFMDFNPNASLEVSGDSFLKLTEAILTEKIGVCRHRSATAISLLRYLGIPCQMQRSQTHDWVEIKASYQGCESWFRLCLGGGFANLRTEPLQHLCEKKPHIVSSDLVPGLQGEAVGKDIIVKTLLKTPDSSLRNLGKFTAYFIPEVERLEFFEHHIGQFPSDMSLRDLMPKVLGTISKVDIDYIFKGEKVSIGLLSDLCRFFFDESSGVNDIKKQEYKRLLMPLLEQVMTSDIQSSDYVKDNFVILTSYLLELPRYLDITFEDVLEPLLKFAVSEGRQSVNFIFEELIDLHYLEDYWVSIYYELQKFNIILDDYPEMFKQIKSHLKDECFKYSYPFKKHPLEEIPDPQFNARYPQLCRSNIGKEWGDISGPGQFRPERLNQITQSKLRQAPTSILNSIIFEATLPLSRRSHAAINALKAQCDANKVNLFMTIGEKIIHVSGDVNEVLKMHNIQGPVRLPVPLNLSSFVSSCLSKVSHWSQEGLEEWFLTEVEPTNIHLGILDNLPDSTKRLINDFSLSQEWITEQFKDPKNITFDSICVAYLFESFKIERFKLVLSQFNKKGNVFLNFLYKSIARIPDEEHRRKLLGQFVGCLVVSRNNGNCIEWILKKDEAISLLISNSHTAAIKDVMSETKSNVPFSWPDFFNTYPFLINEHDSGVISNKIKAWFKLMPVLDAHPKLGNALKVYPQMCFLEEIGISVEFLNRSDLKFDEQLDMNDVISHFLVENCDESTLERIGSACETYGLSFPFLAAFATLDRFPTELNPSKREEVLEYTKSLVKLLIKHNESKLWQKLMDHELGKEAVCLNEFNDHVEFFLEIYYGKSELRNNYDSAYDSFIIFKEYPQLLEQPLTNEAMMECLTLFEKRFEAFELNILALPMMDHFIGDYPKHDVGSVFRSYCMGGFTFDWPESKIIDHIQSLAHLE